MVAVFQVDEGAELGGEVFAALVVLSLKFLDEKMVILVLVGLFVSGGVVEVEGEKITSLSYRRNYCVSNNIDQLVKI